MTESYEGSVKNFIVDEEEYSKEKLTSLMNVLSKFCKITKKGEVFLLKNIPTRKVLKLIMSARFVAHLVDKSISPRISKEELKAYSSMAKESVFGTRFNEMLREHFVDEKDKLFSAKSVLFVEQFLRKLEDKKNG